MTRKTQQLAIAAGFIVATFGTILGVANRTGSPLGASVTADKVIVRKGARELVLLNDGHLLKRYRVALGRSPEGPKQQEGDNRTPEGEFTIDGRNRDSAYHLSLHVSYPDDAALEKARRLGVSAGGEIMIHGIRNGLGWVGALHRAVDWTKGCVAVTNPEIEEIWRAVPDGTPIEIEP